MMSIPLSKGEKYLFSKLYLRLIIFIVGDDVFIDIEILLVIDFMNLKIKSAQSFRSAYKDRMCVCVFIRVSAHTYINICVCTVFLEKMMLNSKCSTPRPKM
jgi:hypothetical protein